MKRLRATLAAALLAAPGPLFAAAAFVEITPCRIADTRVGFGGVMASATVRDFAVTGLCGIPSTARAVALNVIVVAPTQTGFVSLYPSNAPFPGSSTINFHAGESALANGTVVALATSGGVAVEPSLRATYGIGSGSATTHLVLDVTGYFIDQPAVVGATGATGATGPTGANGTPGAAGATGATGSAGEAGATGNPGATGDSGPTGGVGPTGATGSTGAAGADGATGPSGGPGPTGATGDPGAPGTPGTPGAPGTPGTPGSNGSTGPTGAKGAQWRGDWVGAPSPTYAVDDLVAFGGASYIATGVTTDGVDPVVDAANWNLVADKGTAGADGATGSTGSDGATGATGSTGDPGATGAVGATGSTGATGVTGATGESGAPGATGATGSDGDPGTVGPTGATGDPGTPGAPGVTGATGATGASGPAGTPGGGTNRVYRWNVFHTYSNSGTNGWFLNNDPAMFGGVNPSNWTDSNGTAAGMSSDKNVLRTLFTQKGYPGKNALVYADVFPQYSSTTGKVVVSLFRIRNTTLSPINWTVRFAYTCYVGWNEVASVALNGLLAMSDTSCFDYGEQTDVVLQIPANRTSTAIFVSTSGTPLPAGSVSIRGVLHAFTNNSLDLPAGLEFVDDLETATGDFTQ